MKKIVYIITLMLAVVLLTAGCADSVTGTENTGRENSMVGEGIGQVVPLSEGELEYLQAQTTNTWLEMSDMEKSDFVVLIGRWLEAEKSYIIEDYDEFQFMLNRQMEQYFRYSVDEGVLDTVLDILDME